MGLSTVSEIDGDFSRKSQNFPTLLYFVPMLKGFPLELGIGARGQKTRMMGYQADKEVSRYFHRLDRMQERDRQTDGQTLGRSKDRTYA